MPKPTTWLYWALHDIFRTIWPWIPRLFYSMPANFCKYYHIYIYIYIVIVIVIYFNFFSQDKSTWQILVYTQVHGSEWLPMNSYVIISLVMNINNDNIFFVNIKCWSRKLAIYCQDVLCAAQSRIWSFFYLRTIKSLHIY